MKQIPILFSLVLAFGFMNAQETYRFRTDAPQGLNIESSTASGLSLHYALQEITLANIDYGDDKGQEIVLKGCFGAFAEGMPNLPAENHYIAVPNGAKVSVEVKEKGCKTLNDIDLLPSAPLQMNAENERPALRWEMSVFGKDASFPAKNVTIAQTTQIRGLDVVLLSVTPFRYNPVRKTLEVVYDMDIDIRFEGGNSQFGDARYRNPAWDNILRDLVINGDQLSDANYYDFLNEAIRNREEGCEYLIVIPDDPAFLAWADTLRRFRNRQGILTKVVTVTECGGNEPETIRNYILNAYENWTIPPAAVLLFAENHKGDPDFGIKPFIFISPPNVGHTYLYPSDNPFADMNGDSIPDLAISRIVTKYPSECQKQVEKLINYELNPPTEPHYYDHPVISSGYQQDKWFMITSQITNNFFRNNLGKHPTNNYMVVSENPHPTPPNSIWSNGENTQAVLDYFGPNGTQYIPQSIGSLHNWSNWNDKQPLIDAMSEGGFVTFYRDHSNQDAWSCPWFYNEDIPKIHSEWPTFIFSIGCLTNNYWDNWTTCLSESFLNADAGAIGAIGANTVTYSHYNDLFAWGMLDYFWPNFMPSLGSETEPLFAYPSFSLVAGKLFLSQQTFHPYSSNIEKVDKTLNLFSYLGETYLNLYTETPQKLNIVLVPYQNESQKKITLTAEENATVCIAKDGEILHIAMGTGQPLDFDLPEMQSGEQYQVTVTKQNRIRYQQDVTILPDVPLLVMEGYRFVDENEDAILEYGENASIDISLCNASVETSESREITLLCESPYVKIIQGSATCPTLPPNDHITLNDAFRVRIAHDTPDQTPITFKLLLDNGIFLQKIEFEHKVAAPVLSINSDFQFFTEDGKSSTHLLMDAVTYIKSTISNIGHAKSDPIDVRMFIKAPFVSVESQNDMFDGLECGESQPFTFKINPITNETKGAWLQTHIDAQSGPSHFFIDTIFPYGGIYETFETDMLNPLFTWENTPPYLWNYNETDAFQGKRCLEANPPKMKGSRMLLTTNGYIPQGKISFYFKTGLDEALSMVSTPQSGTGQSESFSCQEWTYQEASLCDNYVSISFLAYRFGDDGFVARIDNICFPPYHRPIAYAGGDLVSCQEHPVELSEAYAYDCESMLWTTDGDGHFDCDTIANAIYFPGNQDLANGSTTLTLSAFGNETFTSKTQIHFVDETNLGTIVGDSVVNRTTQSISLYSIENQKGLHFHWQLEPIEAGFIYDYGNTIGILWNLHEDTERVTLSVTTRNGCDITPTSKSIHLTNYSVSGSSPEFEVFPNPTDGKVNLVLGENLQGKAIIEVFNLLGERILYQDASHLRQGETISLDLSRMVSGLYIIKLSTENGSCSKKVSVR